MKVNSLLKLAALALGTAGALAQAQTVVLYSSNNPETIETAINIVKAKAPSLKVQTVTGGTGSLMKRIEALGAFEEAPKKTKVHRPQQQLHRHQRARDGADGQ